MDSCDIAPKRQKMKPSNGYSEGSVIDLRPNTSLLDPKFVGYKLSLDSLPIYSKSLDTTIDYAKPTAEQYSLQHVKLQVFNNHIFPDLWNKDEIYFVDVNWNVLKSSISDQTRCVSDPQKVWTIPGADSKVNGRYNITIQFPSNESAILSDGCGTLYIIKTGDRHVAGDWKVDFRGQLFAEKKNPQFIILDSLLYSSGDSEMLDVLLFRIDEKSEWTDFLNVHKDIIRTTESIFVSLIEWITFTKGPNENWSLQSTSTLLSLYGLHYAAIEEGGTGVYIASDGPFGFAQDSENPIVHAPLTESIVKERKDYVWTQTTDDVTIWFRLPDEARKHDMTVASEANTLKVEYQTNLLLEGNLFQTVKSDETVWTIGDGKLEIVLTKAEKNLMWSSLIPGNEAGEEIVDPELVQQIHEQLAHLCSDKWGSEPVRDVFVSEESEECDELPSDSSVFARLDRKLQKISHQASLGSHQWLLNVRSEPKSVLCFCLRHDVDGIIWQPKTEKPTSEQDALKFNCEHVGTFSAFGYVQASKVYRKFTVCSGDLSYAAICDASKHIHVYRQPSRIENELRNRKTGEKVENVCKQQVIAIDPPHEILGVYAGNEFLFVLTSENVHAVRMNVTEIV